MTDEQIAQLEVLARVATPGPWKESIYPFFIYAGDFSIANITSKNAGDDSAFVAAANPSAILELIADYKQMKKERDWLADYLGAIHGYCEGVDKESWIQGAKDMTLQEGDTK